ncbi:hypothetical protein, partial [Actinomadura kijaniata]|uniref:hypothetical protein n=1 Tax=Actinomadura kijaniata TaxID=46161 RepID=UPI0031D0BCDB
MLGRGPLLGRLPAPAGERTALVPPLVEATATTGTAVVTVEPTGATLAATLRVVEPTRRTAIVTVEPTRTLLTATLRVVEPTRRTAIVTVE